MNVRRLLRNCIDWTDLRDRLVDWIMQDPWMRRCPLSRERAVGSVAPGTRVTWYKKDGSVASPEEIEDAFRPRIGKRGTSWAGAWSGRPGDDYEIFSASDAYNVELDKYAPVKPGSPMRLSWLHSRPYKLYDREIPKASGTGDKSSD